MLLYADTLAKGLSQKGHAVRNISPGAFFGKCLPTSSGLGKWLGHIDKYIVFNIALRRELKGVDVVHVCDHSNSMYLPILRDVPSVITCHDVLAIAAAKGKFKEHGFGWSGKLLQSWISNNLAKAKRIVCVSKTTALALDEMLGIDSDVARVIYNPLFHPYTVVDEQESVRGVAELGVGADVSFVLHVGGNTWYKNRRGVVGIFKELKRKTIGSNLKLVLVGPLADPTLRDEITRSGLSDDVLMLSNIANEDLCLLYNRAKCFVFPSLYEGFGCPPVEAMACGCLVFATNRAPMTEVLGDGAIFIDPEDYSSSASLIANVLEDPDESRAAIKKGLEHIKQFDPSTCVDRYIEIYNQAISDYL